MIEDLAEAIQEKNWDGVMAFYFGMLKHPDNNKIPTQPLVAKGRDNSLDFTMRPAEPKASRKASKATKSTKLSKAQQAKQAQQDESDEAKTPTGRKAKAKKIPLGDRANKFDELVAITVEEPGAEHVRDNVVLTPRTRKPFKLKKTKCKGCAQPFEISPGLYRPNWRCDECILKKRVLELDEE